MPPRLNPVSSPSHIADVLQVLPHPPATKCAHDFAKAGPEDATGVPSGSFAGTTSPSSREEGNDVWPNCGLLSRRPRGAEPWSKVIGSRARYRRNESIEEGANGTADVLEKKGDAIQSWNVDWLTATQ